MTISDDHTGTIEDVVGEARLVDKGVKELQRFEGNAPTFGRREFLKYAAVLAGLIATEKLLSGCAATTAEFGGKTYSGWEADLITQDIIRGPPLAIHAKTGLPSDFKHHLKRPLSIGFGSVDYDVPIETPVTPVKDGRILNAWDHIYSGDVLELTHDNITFGSSYAHLAKRVHEEKGTGVQLSTIIAFSGNTGLGPGPGGYQPPHLDLSIHKRERTVRNGRIFYIAVPPGLDPFKLGIDQKRPIGDYDRFKLPLGGRPVYWDGKTEIDFSIKRLKLLKDTLDTLEKRLKESDLDSRTIQDLLEKHQKIAGLRSYLDIIIPKIEKQEPLDNTTSKELLRRQEEAYGLRDYLGQRVLLKKPSPPDGKPRYEFMPGSLMYALMLEFYNRTSRHDFIAMLPFIFPHPDVKIHYQKANPDVKF